VPRPINTPVRIYQAVSSDDTLDYAARQRHVGVFWQLPPDRFDSTWHRYAELVRQHHGVDLAPGEDRMLVVNLYLGDTPAAAIDGARPGHDELRKLIWPNIVNKNPALASRPMFSLEESMASGAWVVGTAQSVTHQLLDWHARLGFDYLTIFPHFPGMTQADGIDQLRRFHRDVMPALQQAHAAVREPAGARN
jgi:alkanesulfonate monooxygenase SsuD/methylene tetrahydromethanopterin reductase-like flavin-dependent oxidoreductase (luciferase family)